MNPMLATKTEARDTECRANALAPSRPRAPRRQVLPERDHARPAVVRQRFKLGQMDFDYRAFPNQRAVSLNSTDAMIHVIVPITGSAVMVSNDQTFVLGAGSALLLAACDRTATVWAAGSSALFLHVPRAVIQAEASSTSGGPCRLAAIDHLFAWSLDHMGASQPRATVASSSAFSGLEDALLLEKRTLTSLIATLQADAQAERLFPMARSVQRAVEQIRANPEHSWTIHDLAQLVGVTAGTLRRNFRTCLGVTVAQLVQQLRLEWVRAGLESVTESRSISDLSLAAGFSTPAMLTRAYQRRFGETPSQTRTRAFRSPRE